ncbi:MAG: glutamate--tRNA ligase family protein, partial [Chloroflexota bacterium]
GFTPDAGPVRQRENPEPYQTALDLLRMHRRVYACDCTRATIAAWARENASRWRGPGCPGGCRERGLAEDDDLALRVVLGTGDEAWHDRLLGRRTGDLSVAGDAPVRDRHGNWTYGFAVVVDDLRQSITLVVRGDDLSDATPAQVRLGRLLGRRDPPVFAHHPLIRKPGGAKLSKADGDTGIRELRAAGRSPASVIGAAAAAVGLIPIARSVDAAWASALVLGWLGEWRRSL